MKKMFLILAIVFSFGTSHVLADAPTKIFFSPTQADFNCCYQAIKVQQALYVAAKNKHDWATAQKYALFPYVKAWLYYNEAMSLRGDSNFWNNLEKLQKMDALFAQAVGSQPNEKCFDLIEKNDKWIKDRIQKLSSLK